MTWMANRWHHYARSKITVAMYKESNPIIGDNGIVTRTSTKDVFINILLLRTREMLFYDKSGRFIEDGIIFQVSKKELDDNSFIIESGNTFVKLGGFSWRVMSLIDYSYVRHTSLIQCKAVKMIKDVD